MEMETQELLEGQRRLEEKRALLKQTERVPTSLDDDDWKFEATPAEKVCEICGCILTSINFFGTYSLHCESCAAKREEALQKKIADDEIKSQKQALSNRINSRMKDCNIGHRFMGMEFNDYKPTCDKAKKVLSDCAKYVSDFKHESGCNILMIGSPGTGKNMMAAIIGQEVIRRDFTFFHTTAMKLVRRIKDSWRNKEESEQSVINSFVSPDLMVIDEIGVQFGSPTEQLFLTEVINERYEKRRPTILISNLKLSQLTEVMGERVIDRFYDDGSKLMVFDWPSYRRNQAVPNV